MNKKKKEKKSTFTKITHFVVWMMLISTVGAALISTISQIILR